MEERCFARLYLQGRLSRKDIARAQGMENFYQVLGIPRDSDERAIKRAYHRLARELHPDKADNPQKAKEMEQQFAHVSTAYNLLKDAEARAEYDRKTFGASQAPRSGPPPASSSPSTPTSQVMNAPKPTAAPGSSPAPAKPATPAPSPQSQPKVDVGAQRVAIAQKAYVKGMQFLKDRNYAKAAEFFEAAIQNNENEAVYHARLAMALIEAKKSASRAVEAALKAIELDRYNLDFKFALAQIYDAIGSKSNALKVYEEILKWDPDSQVAKQMVREINRKDTFMGKIAPAGGFLEKFMGKFSGKKK